MNRQDAMRDTHIKNIRLCSPLGLLGVPPDRPLKFQSGEGKKC